MERKARHLNAAIVPDSFKLPMRGAAVAFLLRYLLLVTLMLGLASHSAALARGGAEHLEVPSVHAHHATAKLCDHGQCSESKPADSCCILNHCLLGLVAEQTGSLPPFAPARPIAAAALGALAQPRDNPERPPQAATRDA